MEKGEWGKWRDKGRELFFSYRYVLLAAVAGLVLLCWPQSVDRDDVTEGSAEVFSLDAMEERMSRVLSKIEGAGNVTVVLTVERGMEKVLAQNLEQSEQRRSIETVLTGKGSGVEEAVMLVQRYPEFRGALVVCEGGDDPQVRLEVTQAVAALTGLGTGRITVCRGG